MFNSEADPTGIEVLFFEFKQRFGSRYGLKQILFMTEETQISDSQKEKSQLAN